MPPVSRQFVMNRIRIALVSRLATILVVDVSGWSSLKEAEVGERCHLVQRCSFVAGMPRYGQGMDPSVISELAEVDATAVVGVGCKVWQLAQIREGAVVGDNCVIGRGAYVGAGVRVGDNVKLQNLALVYEPAVLGDGVFVGPGAILTNDRNPRSTDPTGHLKSSSDWNAAGVVVAAGASIGAGAVVLGGISIGEWAMVGAGAVVVHDVLDHGLVVGNPARPIGWVGRSGERLRVDGELWKCHITGDTYDRTDRGLRLRNAEEVAGL